MMNQPIEQPDGKAAAALLSAGIGCLVLGTITVLAESIKAFGAAINFYNPAGPLSGKTTIAVLSWLVSWAILAGMWKNRPINIGKVLKATYIMIAVGLLGTFPLFFALFH